LTRKKKLIRRANLGLFAYLFGRVEPMLHVVGVAELQAKVVGLDEVQMIEHLLIQLGRHGLFGHEEMLLALVEKEHRTFDPILGYNLAILGNLGAVWC